MFLKHAPVTLFLVTMGLAGLSLVYKKAEVVLDTPQGYEYLAYFTAVNFAVFLVLYLIKIVLNFEEFKEEITHPIKSNFFPAISIVVLLFSIMAPPDERNLGKVLFAIGMVVQSLFTLWFLGRWWEIDMIKMEQITPAMLIPIVGNALVALSASKQGPDYVEFIWAYFGFALFFWIVLFCAMFTKVAFLKAMPPKLIPSLFIFIAPPAILMITWVSATKELNVTGRALFWIGIFFVVLFIRLLPMFFRACKKTGFEMSWMAFAFPMCAGAISSMEYKHFVDTWFTEALAWALVGLATFIVFVVYVLFLFYSIKGKVFRPEGPPPSAAKPIGVPIADASQPDQSKQPRAVELKPTTPV